MKFQSQISELLIKKTPYFRGYCLILSNIFRILPFSPIATFVLKNKIEVNLNARNRTQLALIKNSDFEKGLIDFYFANIVPGDIVFDVGANWGYFTNLFSKLVENTGMVVSLEANEKTFQKLLKTIVNHKLVNVIPLFFAISNKIGEIVKINLPWYRNDTGAFIASNLNGNVMTQSIDNIWNLLGKPKVKLMKIDIEGFEPLALRGAKEFLTEGVTDFAIVEISEWSLERCGISYLEIYKLMLEFGFIYTYSAHDDEVFQPIIGEDYRFNCNVLFAKSLPKL